MKKLKLVWCVVSGVVIANCIYTTVNYLYYIPDRPKSADLNPWWGAGEQRLEEAVIRKFEVNISDSTIEDWRKRVLNSVELHPPLENIQQQYGFNTNNMKKIIHFWLNEYDWKKREKFLNKFPQFVINIQGLNIHYLHVKPQRTKGVKVLPLLLLHGWPSSTREMFDLIPLLTTPQKNSKFVFEVIAPNLPGFAFSEGSSKPGFNPMQNAIVMKNLMNYLGFQKYYAHGGDWGGHILQILASLFPEKLIGFHSNFCYINTPLSHLKTFLGGFFPSLVIEDEVREKVYPMKNWYMHTLKESGYMHIQATKPDTIGIALTDSPVGLAAYMLEKFSVFSDPQNEFLEDAGLQKHFALEDLLDNVMIYWFTKSITTSMRIYAENFSRSYLAMNVPQIPITVPSACARFSNEVIFPIEWALRDKYTNLIQVTNLKGGHYAPLEVPHELAKDIFMFVEKVEK